MKLAEALQERADADRRIEELRQRIQNNCLVQEGEKPAEDPAELLEELGACLERLEWLMAAINKTNSATVIDGMTLTEMLARRDCLRKRVAVHHDIVNTASQQVRRIARSEIKIKSTVNVRDLQKTADALSHELRLLDNRLQEANWLTELIE